MLIIVVGKTEINTTTGTNKDHEIILHDFSALLFVNDNQNGTQPTQNPENLT